MKERPILFQGPMVRAILDGRKTQTRRIVKPQPPRSVRTMGLHPLESGRLGYFDDGGKEHPCPYGQPGDRLWVRETFLAGIEFDGNGMPTENERVWYRATEPDLAWYNGESDFPSENPPWKPSIHMPRWASRITLDVTGVRVERLHDISDADVWAEGWESVSLGNCDHKDFAALWESINGPASWHANPWVWVVEFKRVEPRPGAGEGK